MRLGVVPITVVATTTALLAGCSGTHYDASQLASAIGCHAFEPESTGGVQGVIQQGACLGFEGTSRGAYIWTFSSAAAEARWENSPEASCQEPWYPDPYILVYAPGGSNPYWVVATYLSRADAYKVKAKVGGSVYVPIPNFLPVQGPVPGC